MKHYLLSLLGICDWDWRVTDGDWESFCRRHWRIEIEAISVRYLAAVEEK